jgi:hypothetical protein
MSAAEVLNASICCTQNIGTHMLYYEASIEQRVNTVDCLFVDEIQYSRVLSTIGPT